ncbi:hypothetical protein KP509_35G048600 [Ceratopteris richardii]|uniref:Uncharacterized protein n=1 Tax=Ceratopteris richardii TaxID=49495 RepID=A0A8T2QHX1_CERRI|nr:hypothetical protein KP509_35G048600 [Ceratopteris richardii]
MTDASDITSLPDEAQEGCEACFSRKEKRKNRKKAKRSERRQLAAIQAREREEILSQDPVVIELEERALERERLEHELQERLWIQKEKEAQEAADRKRQEAEAAVEEDANDWEYVEEGPAEIIWEGNEIIVRKQKVKVPKARSENIKSTEENRPVSNPLLPESLYQKPVSNLLPSQNAAYEDHKKLVHSSILENNESNPNFGTEQDKTHCPFHIKTGVCRFGVNCSRVHVYPDKSCTLLIKNMYHGPGLPMEHDEGLEYTDEEIAQNYKEFFDDVHGEFMKHGKIINFKVCRNESSHLRGNVYAQYESVESAVTAYNALNGRFYAGKQITCEYVVVTRWRAALCGEYMRSHHRSCSHGTACNFLHCFKNPHGLYDWADWDNPPPKSRLRRGDRRDSLNEDRPYREKDNHSHSHRRYRESSFHRDRSGRSHERDKDYGGYRGDKSLDRSHGQIKIKDRSHKRIKYGDRHRSSEEERSIEEDYLEKERQKRSRKRRSRGQDGQYEGRRPSSSRSHDRDQYYQVERSKHRKRSRSLDSGDSSSYGKQRTRRKLMKQSWDDDRYRPRSRSSSLEQGRKCDSEKKIRSRSSSYSDGYG